MIFRGPFQLQPFCDFAVTEVGVLLAINLLRDMNQHRKSFSGLSGVGGTVILVLNGAGDLK